LFLQHIIDILYRSPRSKYKTIMRFGGFISYYKMLKGKNEMISASKLLPPILSHQNGLAIYFLTGKDFVYQTLFCAHSLVKVSKEQYQFILIDDGSFNEVIKAEIERQMPNVVIINANEINSNLDFHLPIERFPFLRNKRIVYPHLKKLTDIHTLNSSTKLVLDSDMLFFREPTEMIKWLKQPTGCLFMIDCEESYGYSRKLMEELAGYRIPKMVNVGAFGFNSSSINWQKLEDWGSNLEKNEGTTYYLEQALSAMLVANEQPKISLSKEEYIVNPSTTDFNEVKLHHYVDLSKQFYFNSAWKISIDQRA